MYRQFGSSALLFLVFSAFVSNVGGGAAHFLYNGKPTKDDTAAKAAETKPAEGIVIDTHRCAVAEILRRHYGKSEDSDDPQPGDRLPDFVCNSPASQLILSGPGGSNPGDRGTVLIATVPDPLQSANVLEFDRDIEALQEAAVTGGYDFESIFTEWDISSLAEPKDVKEGREAEHYRRVFGDQPGAMLFHRRPLSNEERTAHPSAASGGDLLLIILVPESPTYGLNMHAANEALYAVLALRSHGFASKSPEARGDEITWIGPNYSSSVSGLESLAKPPATLFNVFSGSITSKTAIDGLKRINCYSRIQGGKDEAAQCWKQYPDSEVTASPLDKDVLDVLGSSGVLGRDEKNKIALLQEDESSYGSGSLLPVDQDGNVKEEAYQIRTFHFPRGISHVRRVFGSQYTNYKPTGGGAAAPVDPKSVFDLGDTLQQPLDTAPEFSAQSPYSNEGELASVVSSIQHMDAAAVVILATDPLDSLFLARYLRQKDPDTRIVLFGAERLVPDLRGQYDLDGVLTVTRFPLFEDSYMEAPRIFGAQGSLDAPGVSRYALSFMNSVQEGIFFAALHQIHPYPMLEATSDPKQNTQMPTWISIASGGSFWPLRSLGGGEPFSPNRNRYVISDIPPEPLPRLWIICVSLALLCAGVHFVLYLAGGPFNAVVSNSPWPWLRPLARHRILAFYLPCKPSDVREYDREFGRRYWMLAATGQIVLLLSFLLWPACVVVGSPSIPNSFSELGQTLFGLFALVFYLVACAHFVQLLFELWDFRSSSSQPDVLSGSSLYIVMPDLTILWLVFSLAFFGVHLWGSDDGWIFALRAVHLASGVSPVLPLLLASFGFLTAAIVNLNALALARDRNPQMPEVRFGSLRLIPCEDQLVAFTECWSFLPPPQGGVLSFFVVVWILVVRPWKIFASLDGAGMTTIFVMNVVFGLWTIAWLWARFLSIWSHLRSVLEALEGSALRFAFSRLPKIFSLAPIWSYAGLRRSLILPMRWFEYLRVAPTQSGHAQHLEREGRWLSRISSRLFHNQVLIDGGYIDFSRDQNAYAATLAANQVEVKASWKRGGADAEIGTVNDSTGVIDHDGMRSRIDVPAPCLGEPPDPCVTAIANEYIAMRFGAYIRYITLQLKNLMTFMSIGLLFFLLATVSYPFREPRGIAWSLVVLVGILLVGVGAALMQMDRDSILSRMSETTPGKVERGAFLWHMLSVGGLPVITAVAALFPSVGNFLFSWLQPLLATLH